MHDFVNNTGIYSTCWILFFVGAGVLTYIVDRSYLYKAYVWFYDLTHQEPLSKPKGFVFGRGTGYKIVIATIASTVQSLYMVRYTNYHANPFVELILWFVEIPAMVIGMGLGFAIFPWWEKRSKLYKVVDAMDEKIEATLEKRNNRPPPPAAPPPSTPVTPPVAPVSPAPETPKEPELTPQERIERYAAKR